jgi:5-methyltetrahydrofolate--homocysteine methyltransferase
MDEKCKKIYDCVLNGDRQGIDAAVQAALADNIQANEILFNSMIPAMDEVGKLYVQGEYFVPEMLMAAYAMRSGLAVLKPYLKEDGIESLGKIAIGTVKGDLHDIGKNLVSMMLEGAGFEIQDLGADVGPEKFIEAIQSGAQIIGLSALLTTTMPQMDAVIKAIKAANLRDQVKIMIGGAPVTQGYADQIGADGFAPDASTSVALARKLIKK